MADVFEKEGSPTQDAAYREHLDRNWEAGNKKFAELEGKVQSTEQKYDDVLGDQEGNAKDKKEKERFYFTDYFLNIPKRKYFDPFICANICEESASFSYSKAGKIISNRIGKRINKLQLYDAEIKFVFDD